MIRGQIASTNKDFSQALDSKDIQEARRLLNSGAIHSATHNDLIKAVHLGDLEIIDTLLSFPETLATIVTNKVLLEAVAIEGHINVVNRLLEIPVINEAIASNNNEALGWAIYNGDFDIVNRLLEFPAVVAAIITKNNEELVDAIKDGHLAIVNRLLEIPAIVATITDSKILKEAIMCNHFAVVNRLLDLPAVKDTIAANHNEALREATKKGHLAIVNRLLEFSAVKNAIGTNYDSELGWAVYSGNLAVVNRMLEIPAVKDAIVANDNNALKMAARVGHLDVVNRLLEFPAVVVVIDADNNAALRVASLYGCLDVVNRLLEFPAVMAAVTANDNAALRNALHNDRHAVVDRLRQIPAVAAYEAAHPEPIAADLATIAQDDESSIRSLSSNEQEELSVLKKRYADLFQKQELEGILSGLCKHLIAKYFENPAQYQGQSLPLEYDAKLDKEVSKEYYKNPYHTAYRYLFCQPNPWMAPDAIWVNRDAQNNLSANISDATKENIAYLWLAASDKTLPLPKDFTSDDIQNRFVDLLADAGRGHNWDNKRTKTIFKDKKPVEIEEAFDDGEGDKPSCSLGVTRRTVAQFLLLLQPEVKPLNVDMIYLQFKERLVTQNSQKNGLFDKIIALSPSNLERLKSALRSFVLNAMKMEDLSVDEQGLLKALCVDASVLNSLIKSCQQDFGERFAAKGNIKWQGENFDFYETLVQHFAQNVLTVFYNEIAKKCEDLTTKKLATTEPPAPVVLLMPAAAPLLFSSPKKLRSKRRSEVQLLESFLSAPRRSTRLIAAKHEKHKKQRLL